MVKYSVVMGDVAIAFRQLLRKLPTEKDDADSIINHRFDYINY